LLLLVCKVAEQRLRTPSTSSVGRLFDAVASLAGIRDRTTFEGQAAIALEALAAGAPEDPSVYAFDVARGAEDGRWIIDTRPLVRDVVEEIARGVKAAVVARRFHVTLAAIVADVCERIRASTGLHAVALSGGCFVNALLLRESDARLRAAGFVAHTHRQVPPNDGGLCLGQLAIAAALDAAAGA
jgi:hydrogenase maturation protein HypF